MRISGRLAIARGFLRSRIGEGYGTGAMCLPFNTSPPLASYLDSAYPMGIVTCDDGLEGALLNHQVQLFFPKDKLESGTRESRVLIIPPLRIKNFAALGYLRIEELSYSADTPARKCIGNTIEAIRNGKYVLSLVDEYFIPSGFRYMRQHYVHLHLLIGCECQKDLFIGIMYKKDGSFGPTNIPFGLFFEALIGAARLSPRGTTPMLRIDRQRTYRGFDVDLARRQLREYLDGVDNGDKYACGEYAVPGYEFPPKGGVGYYGTAVYAAFEDYFKQVAKNREPIDLRATRTLMEHKVMLVEMARAHNQLPFLARAIHELEHAVALATKFRLLAYAYNCEPSIGAMSRLIDTMRELAKSERIGILSAIREK